MDIALTTNPIILIATLGSEPQVVTAALDLLLRQGEPITRAVVLHTVSSGTPISAAVDTLAVAFQQSPYQGRVALQLLPMTGSDGQALVDVETPRATRSAFRALYNQVRTAKQAGYRIHLSIAGGRKTLSIFGMVTAQLLFDDNDHLWHLYSGGDFLASKRLHPQPGDDVHLIPIPVILWSRISPVFTDLSQIDDPFEAVERVRRLQLAEKMEQGRSFVLGSLTPAEERVVSLFVREGLGDSEIAGRLGLSPRTVEQHLRSAYTKAAAHWELEDVSRAQLVALLSLYYAMR